MESIRVSRCHLMSWWRRVGQCYPNVTGKAHSNTSSSQWSKWAQPQNYVKSALRMRCDVEASRTIRRVLWVGVAPCTQTVPQCQLRDAHDTCLQQRLMQFVNIWSRLCGFAFVGTTALEGHNMYRSYISLSGQKAKLGENIGGCKSDSQHRECVGCFDCPGK